MLTLEERYRPLRAGAKFWCLRDRVNVLKKAHVLMHVHVESVVVNVELMAEMNAHWNKGIA